MLLGSVDYEGTAELSGLDRAFPLIGSVLGRFRFDRVIFLNKVDKRGKRLPAPRPFTVTVATEPGAAHAAACELTGFCCSGAPSTDARSLAYFAVLCAD
jgi:hypothetical protein